MTKKRRLPQPVPGPRDSRAAEAATIAWMLTVMTTLFCASGAAIVWLFVRGHEEGKQAMVLAHLLHFSSIVAALISLMLLPVVLKTRHVAPPPSITVFAVIVALLSIMAAFI